MAGRGRGRGRGGPPAHAGTPLDPARLAQLGGGGLSAAFNAPPPVLFPPRILDPSPLEENEDILFMVRRSYDLSKEMESSSYWVMPLKPQVSLERYTDKYRVKETPPSLRSTISESCWKWFPRELIPPEQLKKMKKIKKPRATAEEKALMTEEQLRELEKKEKELEEKEGEEREGEGEGEEAVDYDEEMEEDGNDYVESYFDNGDGAGDDDGGEDEAMM